MRLLLSLLAVGCFAQDYSTLDHKAQQHIDKNKIPGAVLVVVRGERIAYAKGFGVANIETKEPVTPNHLFRVGSTTKMMVAATVVMLSDETRLRLTDPVDRFIPNLDPSIGRLTAHQLLSHTSGLLDRAPMYGPQDDVALADNVRGWKSDMFFTEPGKVYSYSNPGFALAGRLIESVSGKPFADAVADLIFKPAGMTRSTFRPTLAMTYPLAQGHLASEQGSALRSARSPGTLDADPVVREFNANEIARPAGNNAAYWPAGSMFTSGNEFARFAMVLMHGGEVQGKRVLSENAVRLMTTQKVRVDGATEGRFYGYGLSLDPEFDVVEHAGARLGYASHLIMHPKDKLAVLVLLNRNGADATTLAHSAMDWVLGQKSAVRRPPASQSKDLATYSGVYRNGPESVISVQAGEPEHLSVTIGERKLEMAPAQWGNCFEGGKPAATVCFSGSYLLSGGRAFAKQ